MKKFDIESHLAAIADIAAGADYSQQVAESGISPELIAARGMMFVAIRTLAERAGSATAESELSPSGKL